MIAGLLLVVSGGLVALGVSNDWLTAPHPGSSDFTLHVVGTGFGSALFAIAGLLAILGLWRIGRGYSEDQTVEQLSTLAAVAGLLVAIARIELFLSDHGFGLGDSSTYSNLTYQPGLFFVAGGFILALLTRLA